MSCYIQSFTLIMEKYTANINSEHNERNCSQRVAESWKMFNIRYKTITKKKKRKK